MPWSMEFVDLASSSIVWIAVNPGQKIVTLVEVDLFLGKESAPLVIFSLMFRLAWTVTYYLMADLLNASNALRVINYWMAIVFLATILDHQVA